MRQRAFLLLPLLLVVAGCSEQQDLTGVPDAPPLSAQVTGAPMEVPLYFEWYNIPNACTGLPHDIVAEGTLWYQPHKNQTVARVRLWITTTSGFEGRRWETHVDLVEQAGLYKATFHDLLVHPSGARMRWLFAFLFDTSTGTYRVYNHDSECVRPFPSSE